MGAFTATGLERLRRVLARHVEGGPVPGLVALVDRGGETEVVDLGATAVDGGTPVARDTIFRITSMTKPVTAVAALMLVEDCVLRLDEPVDALLPELADRRVLTRLDAPLDDTVPADRPITLRDLLTFTMGFGQLLAAPADYPVLAAAAELKIGTRAAGAAADAAAGRVAAPARRAAADVPARRAVGVQHRIGRARRAGRAGGRDVAVGAFLAERVFEPLGMTDTGFSVPAGSLDRFVPSYRTDPATGALSVYDPVTGTGAGRRRSSPAPAGWSPRSTTCCAFGRMLRSGGGPLLSRASGRGDDHRPAHAGPEGSRRPGCRGRAAAGVSGSAWPPSGPGTAANPGRYGWDGGLGTSWSCDPGEDLVGMLMTQVMWSSAGRARP